jgi:D-alanyl-D-alanine carboxypeptidase (penicillin-binding protein 5/6)
MKQHLILALCLPLFCIQSFAQTPAPAAAPAATTPIPATTRAAATGTPIPNPPSVPTKGYILMDFNSGRVLAEQLSKEKMEPASITKLMTAYIVFVALREKRLLLTEDVVISEHAWRSEGSRTFVQVGSRIPAEVLIKGMIVQSGNDATIALAERIGGTEPAFVQMMNEYAKRLGMTGSNFDNSWGGPSPNHYSTAQDLAVLSQALVRDFPEYYRWYSLREFVWNGIKQENRNGLLTRDPTVDGIKTGHTESAKYCLVSSAKRNGMRLIAVVLGSPTIKAREDASAALLNYGFTFYETIRLHEGGKMLLKPRVFKSEAEFAAVGTRQDIYATVPRGESGALLKSADINAPLIAPLAAGAKVGEFTVTAGGQVVSRVPLVTLAEVPAGGLWRRTSDSVRLWFN